MKPSDHANVSTTCIILTFLKFCFFSVVLSRFFVVNYIMFVLKLFFQTFFPDQTLLNAVPDLQVRMELRVIWACPDPKDRSDGKVKKVHQVKKKFDLKSISPTIHEQFLHGFPFKKVTHPNCKHIEASQNTCTLESCS